MDPRTLSPDEQLLAALSIAIDQSIPDLELIDTIIPQPDPHNLEDSILGNLAENQSADIFNIITNKLSRKSFNAAIKPLTLAKMAAYQTVPFNKLNYFVVRDNYQAPLMEAIKAQENAKLYYIHMILSKPVRMISESAYEMLSFIQNRLQVLTEQFVLHPADKSEIMAERKQWDNWLADLLTSSALHENIKHSLRQLKKSLQEEASQPTSLQTLFPSDSQQTKIINLLEKHLDEFCSSFPEKEVPAPLLTMFTKIKNIFARPADLPELQESFQQICSALFPTLSPLQKKILLLIKKDLETLEKFLPVPSKTRL